jgi:hypothetical protein
MMHGPENVKTEYHFLDIVSLHIDTETIPAMDQYNSLQCQLTHKVIRIFITSIIECHKESHL